MTTFGSHKLTQNFNIWTTGPIDCLWSLILKIAQEDMPAYMEMSASTISSSFREKLIYFRILAFLIPSKSLSLFSNRHQTLQ